MFGPSTIMRNSFKLIAGGGEDGSVLRVVGILLLLRLDSRTDSEWTEYVLRHDIEGIPPLAEVNKGLDCVCLKWSTTYQKDQCVVGGEKLKNRTETERGWVVWSGTFQYHLRCSASSTGQLRDYTAEKIPPWSYHCFYINRFNRDDLLNLGSPQSE